MPTLTGGQENKLEKLSFLLHDLFNIAEASFPRPTLSNFGSVALPPSTEYYVSTITLNIFKNSEKMAQRKSFVPILETIVGDFCLFLPGLRGTSSAGEEKTWQESLIHWRKVSRSTNPIKKTRRRSLPPRVTEEMANATFVVTELPSYLKATASSSAKKNSRSKAKKRRRRRRRNVLHSSNFAVKICVIINY
ncbi:hypothetical protein Fcan01_26663 [Folsomia candida]|uniref:Uncharacterized protein n=1 Tax=Folsomia candida TaxID=158441 RepID=A0A226CZ41_FOLCA|nr:hypothetical protein Fcan01_26663 [Folsomia candida]